MTDPIFSPAAQYDIEGIYDYTAQQWGVTQAEHYVGTLRDICYGLAQGKKKGRDIGYVRTGYRKKASGSHFIFYQELSLGIEIVRILHQRMDFESHLSQI